jgi:murein DD-endopeptidase MepM/ murein hydrolase activator NlpD
MRWPSLILVAALCGSARADRIGVERIERLLAAERTIELIAAREREQRPVLRSRVRALVMHHRPGAARLWVDRPARSRWLASTMARILRRDLTELRILAAERDAAVAARDRARAELALALAPSPGARSLVRPVARGRIVAPFGARRHRASRADLSGRGVELASRPGDPIVAVASGRVRWTGRLAGLRGVLIDHDGYLSALFGFAALRVAAGRQVIAGEVLGEAGGDSVLLEIRLRTGAFGHPIDPAPLFR